MIKYLLVVPLSLSLLITVGCGENNEKAAKFTRGGRGPDTKVGTNNPQGQPVPPTVGQRGTVPTVNQIGSFWGLVTPTGNTVQSTGGSQNLNANDVVRAFLSTNFYPDDIGATTGEPDAKPCQNPANCGIILSIGTDTNNQRAPLRFQNNIGLNQVGAGQARFDQGASILMGIYDSLVGTQGADGHTISAIPVYIPIDATNSAFQNNSFVISFRDNMGTVTLRGNINGQVATGTIEFYNIVNYSQQSTETRGMLGNFQINKCVMFQCQ